jgi:hypothetical protein
MAKKAENEIGNILFNNGNKNQYYECPSWVIALLKDIDNALQTAYWNKNQKEMNSPFSNTGNNYEGKCFEVPAYNWDDETPQTFNFKCVKIEISWYKYLGRDTTVNGEYSPQEYISMYNKIVKELKK